MHEPSVNRLSAGSSGHYLIPERTYLLPLGHIIEIMQKSSQKAEGARRLAVIFWRGRFFLFILFSLRSSERTNAAKWIMMTKFISTAAATSQVRNVTLDSIIRLDRGLLLDNALKRPTGVVEDDCRHTLNTHLVLWIHGAPKPTSTITDYNIFHPYYITPSYRS